MTLPKKVRHGLRPPPKPTRREDAALLRVACGAKHRAYGLVSTCELPIGHLGPASVDPMTQERLREMTVVRVEQQPDLTYRVHLPFRVATAVDEAHARRLVYGEAPGSAIRWVPMSAPVPLTEAEMRELWGK